ncbi:MAG: nucleotide sugar dehydrogenase [Pseudomonadota bacterium]|nr:nucleotide sugar dehydrogenase [Pseudomonadota bacterium]
MASSSVAIIGLGYVGLPLALALARHNNVIAYDTSKTRVAELKNGFDITGEVSKEELESTNYYLTNEPKKISGADFLIITVPTPVDSKNRPDLSHVLAACKTIGKVLKKGATVVLESTVYPGVTENICGPLLENASGLKSGKDFFLGYSPERINPGDKEHTIDKITKVVAGQTSQTTKALSNLYGTITSGGIFIAKSIKTAEAAKVIENAQRDINIAFINEVGMIFNLMGLSTHDVLAAAKTKWNFLDFEPGLVGGHCIGIDPYYLAHLAFETGHNPEVILAGRKINDGFAKFIAKQIYSHLKNIQHLSVPARILVLGLTFKENIPDLRNSKVMDLINALNAQGHKVDVHDPVANFNAIKSLFGLSPLENLDDLNAYDCIIGAVRHDVYTALSSEDIATMVKPNGLIVDLKGMWKILDLDPPLKRMEI